MKRLYPFCSQVSVSSLSICPMHQARSPIFPSPVLNAAYCCTGQRIMYNVQYRSPCTSVPATHCTLYKSLLLGFQCSGVRPAYLFSYRVHPVLSSSPYHKSAFPGLTVLFQFSYRVFFLNTLFNKNLWGGGIRGTVSP